MWQITVLQDTYNKRRKRDTDRRSKMERKKKNAEEKKGMTEAQKRAIGKYRSKGNHSMIQLLYMKEHGQPVLDEELSKYGITAPELLRLLIENDYNGNTFNMPLVKKGDSARWIAPIFEAKKKVSKDICLNILGDMSVDDIVALGAICRSAGNAQPVDLIMEMAAFISCHSTYTIGEVFLRCFEAEGGNREDFLCAVERYGLPVCNELWPREEFHFLVRERGKKAASDEPKKEG